MTPAVGRAALQYVAGTLLGGVHTQDICNIVDGNRGAILFRISGKQAADFFGVPLQPLGVYNVKSAEKFIFDTAGLVSEVTTITPIGIMKDQMKGLIEPPPLAEDSFRQGIQTSPSMLELIRKNMKSPHVNVMADKGNEHELLALEDVENDENGTMTHGRKAFAALISSHNIVLGSFPHKTFHDADILADGKFGTIEYIWMGAQNTEYKNIPVKEGTKVKGRGMLFFDFDGAGLVTKATSVYDESVIEKTLLSPGAYSYV